MFITSYHEFKELKAENPYYQQESERLISEGDFVLFFRNFDGAVTDIDYIPAQVNAEPSFGKTCCASRLSMVL